jgi:hypothetical protein
LVHDDATSYIPFVSSVFRFQQSYRATDAAAAIYRTERDVIQFDHWCIEGGVWQAKRTLAVLGGRFISAKGRPNQKLVENYIGRLWTVMAGQPGDVGRHQAELKRNSDLYVRARQGRVDPREHFMSLTLAQESLYQSIQYLNEKKIMSRTYGNWVPQDRWNADLYESPRPARANEQDFMIQPVAETRKVRNGTIKITEEGPHGVPMIWAFQASWLWQYEGRELTAYFDPLAEWPVAATITLPESPKAIGTAECVSPLDASKDRAVEMAKSIRQAMMTEVRILTKMHTERTVRHPGGIVQSSTVPAPSISLERVSTVDTPETLPIPSREIAQIPTLDRSRAASAPLPRITRDDLANSLSRRAARLREEAEI